MNRQFDYANVKNPEYFCDGRMEAYSDHAYYASETDMVDGNFTMRGTMTQWSGDL